MSTIRIHTTQNVTLEYEVASVGERIGATLLDVLIVGAWGLGWTLLLGALGSTPRASAVGWSDPAGILTALLLAFLLAPYVVYNLVCEVFFNGQSLGKRALHLRVMRLDGSRPRLGDYLLRWLLRPFEIVTFLGGLAALTILLNGRGQRLGDLLAGTTVLRLRPRAGTLLAAEAAAPPADYQPLLPQAAQLTDRDVALVRQLLSQGLKQGNYVVLHETAARLKELLGVRLDMGDEAFLRTLLRDHAHLLRQAEERQ